MNCHNNKNENNKAHSHSPLKHMLHMVVCCGLPILIVSALPFISRFSPGAGRMLAVIAPFICPIIMFSMMAMMMGRRGSKKPGCCDEKEDVTDTMS